MAFEHEALLAMLGELVDDDVSDRFHGAEAFRTIDAEAAAREEESSMSAEPEEGIRNPLHGQGTELDLPLGALAQPGRRRIRRRQAIAGGTVSLAVAAVSVIAVTGWTSASGGETPFVATNEQTSPEGSDTTPPPPRLPLITRAADDPFPGLYAHLSGTLVVTVDNCIAVASSRGDRRPVGIVWGHGWSAGWEDGRAVVYDADGKFFAREGDQIGVGGGGTLASKYPDNPCATDPMFEVNDMGAPGSATSS